MMQKVAVIGQGYVGLPLSLQIVTTGAEVVGFDLNSDLVHKLNNGKSHIEDVPDAQLLKHLNNGRYRASSDPIDLAYSDVVIIAVPTPLNANREPDLTFLESASVLIGKNLKRESLIINESTSFPGTLRNIIMPLVMAHSVHNHMYAISPERVDPGNKSWDMQNTPRIFAGITDEASDLVQAFYSKFCSQLVRVSSPEVAEAAKIFENTFRQVNIALVNEFALISRALGIPVFEVLEAAATKPYGFMKFQPGLGVGGHCIPVDPSYLSYISRKVGIEPKFIDLANEVNFQMPNKITSRIKNECGGSLYQKKVLICGVSYKKNIGDTRETPVAQLVHALESEGALVTWHDPLVENWMGMTSISIKDSHFDITILTVHHDIFNEADIKGSADYIFDCTGTLSGVNTL